MSDALTYRDAGVDIDAGNALVERIKPLVKRTFRPEVMGGLGGFGGLFALGKKYREPVLVSGTDGVGTKLKLAQELGRHDTIGIDLVGMCVNDVLVQGAEPLFFLDYFATGKLDVDTAAAVVGGIARGCELAGCALGSPSGNGVNHRRAAARRVGLQNSGQIDLYEDITAALASDTDREAYLDHRQSADVRRQLWKALHGGGFHLMKLDGEFLHLGTTRQFRDAMVLGDAAPSARLFQQNILAHGAAHVGADRRVFHSVLLGESGLALAMDRDALSDLRGVLTPAAAMGDALLARFPAAEVALETARLMHR